MFKKRLYKEERKYAKIVFEAAGTDIKGLFFRIWCRFLTIVNFSFGLCRFKPVRFSSHTARHRQNNGTVSEQAKNQLC